MMFQFCNSLVALVLSEQTIVDFEDYR